MPPNPALPGQTSLPHLGGFLSCSLSPCPAGLGFSARLAGSEGTFSGQAHLHPPQARRASPCSKWLLWGEGPWGAERRGVCHVQTQQPITGWGAAASRGSPQETPHHVLTVLSPSSFK